MASDGLAIAQRTYVAIAFIVVHDRGFTWGRHFWGCPCLVRLLGGQILAVRVHLKY